MKLLIDIDSSRANRHGLRKRGRKMQMQDREKGPDGAEMGFAPLKNPLPAPQRRSHIRMEFDLTDSDEDDFDLEISDGDDFDI